MSKKLLEPLGTTPIIDLTVNVFKFWSFLQPKTPARLVIIPIAVMNVFQFFELYRGWDDFKYSIINAFLSVLFFNAVLRAIILMKNREKFESFIKKIDKLYNEMLEIKDPIIQSIISENTARARLLTRANYTVGLVISIFYCIYPMLSGRFLPYNLWVPGVNVLATPLYEIIYLTQELNRFINFHTRLIDFIAELNDLVSFLCLIEFLSFGLMLIALLTLLNIIAFGTVQFFIVFSYICMILSQIFIWYWHSNEVREESMAISGNLYDSDFTNFTTDMKKKMILIMLRAQRPLEIKAGNWVPMTLESFQTLLNTAYSYFNVTRTFNN